MSPKTGNVMDTFDRIFFGEVDEFFDSKTQHKISLAWPIHTNYQGPLCPGILN
jgi:hypothetical protein